MEYRTASRAPADTLQSDGTGFLELLRERTRLLHVEAERSGIINALLRGIGTRGGYALLLRNLLPAYRELERGLDRHVESRGVRAIALPALYRAPAIEADLVALAGPRWSEALSLLPAGQLYARGIAMASDGDGAGLIAHAYVRYLGDLSGGQIVKRLLAKSLGLGATALTYYDFADIADITAFKANYLCAFDGAAIEIRDVAPVIDEAAAAFKLNIVLSQEVYAAVPK